MLELLVRLLSFPLGLLIVLLALASAVRTFVLPRSSRDPITREVFRNMRQVFNWLNRRSTTYAQRDRLMAFYAPVSLLILPVVLLTLVVIGFTLMYWAVGIPDLYDAYRISGSSLLTLGFEKSELMWAVLLEFVEAAIGLILIALLIAYLPTMYNAFSQREAAVALLEVRAGSPPFCVEMLLRYHRLHSLEALHDAWVEWERWFVQIDETHTSLAPLTFFRSPDPDRSWVTAAGTVLDAAALTISAVDIPMTARATCVSGPGISRCAGFATAFRSVTIRIQSPTIRSASAGRSSTRPVSGCARMASRWWRTAKPPGERLRGGA